MFRSLRRCLQQCFCTGTRYRNIYVALLVTSGLIMNYFTVRTVDQTQPKNADPEADGTVLQKLSSSIGWSKDQNSQLYHMLFDPSHLHPSIRNYFEEERRCRETESWSSFNISDGNRYCPCIPPLLKGRVAIASSHNVLTLGRLAQKHSDVLPGGEWSPASCLSRSRVAIIIPYRDRKEHLRIFFNHMLPIFKRQLTHFRLFLTEQNLPAIFNKASMMNIGFLEARKLFDFDCVIFHDIDILMEDDRNLVNCNGFQPHHFAISLDRWNYKLKYESIFGAVVSMRSEFFERINGFSNSYFGWGGEDDDMGARVRLRCKVFRPPAILARYRAIKHKRDKAFEANPDRSVLVRRSSNTSSLLDGLTTISYTLLRTQTRPLFTHFLADLNVTSLPYPAYKSYDYWIVEGSCSENGNRTLAAKDLVQITCQYECDTSPSCVGFLFSSTADKSCVHLMDRGCVPAVEASRWRTYLKITTNSSRTLK